MRKIILIKILCMISLVTNAWDGVHSGKITSIDLVPSDGENYAFRVSLRDSPKLCKSSNTWAYINKSEDNYDASVSVLLAAKMAQNEITIYTNRDKNNYCRIGYITLQ